MLKIVAEAGENGSFVLRLEGRVIGPWVKELRRSCERTLATATGLTLDLSHVSFLDRDGVELLRSLGVRDVVLVNCSPFVAEQLKAAKSSADRTWEGAEHGG
jgi:anti-anti-sigma regulatory factor